MYAELRGHPLGLASAALTYNRGPELHVALARTMLYRLCAHFYDDHLTVDTESRGGLWIAGLCGFVWSHR